MTTIGAADPAAVEASAAALLVPVQEPRPAAGTKRSRKHDEAAVVSANHDSDVSTAVARGMFSNQVDLGVPASHRSPLTHAPTATHAHSTVPAAPAPTLGYAMGADCGSGDCSDSIINSVSVSGAASSAWAGPAITVAAITRAVVQMGPLVGQLESESGHAISSGTAPALEPALARPALPVPTNTGPQADSQPAGLGLEGARVSAGEAPPALAAAPMLQSPGKRSGRPQQAIETAAATVDDDASNVAASVSDSNDCADSHAPAASASEATAGATAGTGAEDAGADAELFHGPKPTMQPCLVYSMGTGGVAEFVTDAVALRLPELSVAAATGTTSHAAMIPADSQHRQSPVLDEESARARQQVDLCRLWSAILDRHAKSPFYPKLDISKLACYKASIHPETPTSLCEAQIWLNTASNDIKDALIEIRRPMLNALRYNSGPRGAKMRSIAIQVLSAIDADVVKCTTICSDLETAGRAFTPALETFHEARACANALETFAKAKANSDKNAGDGAAFEFWFPIASYYRPNDNNEALIATYAASIESPICFADVSARLYGGTYASLEAFQCDVARVFSNARTFWNGKADATVEKANLLEKDFSELLQTQLAALKHSADSSPSATANPSHGAVAGSKRRR